MLHILFSGTIPTEIGQLISLRELYLFLVISRTYSYFSFLEGEHIQGTLPTELGNLDRIDTL